MSNFLRRGFDPDAAQHACREPGTKIRFSNFDGKISFAARSRQLRLHRFEWQIVDCRCLAGDAVVIHRVGPVGADLHLENGVLARAAHRFYGNPRGSKILRQSPVIYPKLDKITNPLWRKFHFWLSALSHQLSALFRVKADSFSPKLLQKPDITLEEQLNVIHAVL